MTTSTVSDSMLASIRKMVEQAQTLKPPIQRIADVISSYFTPFVLVITVIVFVIWVTVSATTDVDTGDLHFVPFSLQFAITVLVVSCPCAIGLATPTAIMVGTGVAARKGILFKGGPAMEACHRIEVLAFDKTGTLTMGKPSVTGCEILAADEEDGQTPMAEEEFWYLIGSAESGSEHTLGRALLEHAKSCAGRPLTEPEDFEATPGKGIACAVGGTRVLVGNRAFVADHAAISETAEADAAEQEENGNTVVWVVVDGRIAGYVSLADEPRPEAEAVVRQLQQRMGIEVWLVSGDNSRTVHAIAERLGIDNAIGDVLPGGKADKVRELQERKPGRSWRQCWLRRRNTVVGMVGDGVNDSPALTQADVGIAVGAGMDIAVQAADVVLVKSDMRDILLALDLSRATYRRILINFGWAFLYNALAIPLAAGILYPATDYAIPPAVAGLSEIVSTLPVIFSSLLLRLHRVPGSVRKLYKQT
jgi:Cu+-exporting ATPase